MTAKSNLRSLKTLNVYNPRPIGTREI